MQSSSTVKNDAILQSSSTAKSKEKLGHIRGFDGLRAIAVSLVFVEHLGGPIVHDTHLPFGDVGVFLFFLLSGFLITKSLRSDAAQKKPREVFRSFYLKRFLRIFPVYYVTIFLLAAFAVPNSQSMLPWNILYLSNIYIFLQGHWIPHLSHFWSLSLEEQFYLIWPTAFLLLTKENFKSFCIIFCIAAPVSAVLIWAYGYPMASVKTFPLATIEYIAFGSYLAVAHGDFRVSKVGYIMILAVLSVVFMIASLFSQFFFHTTLIPAPIRLSLFLFPIAAILLYIYDNQNSLVTNILSAAPLVFLGRISYGFYLFHNPLRIMSVDILNGTGLNEAVSAATYFWIKFFLTLTLSLIAARASYVYFEKPLLRLKRYA